LNLDTILQIIGLVGDVGVLVLSFRARLFRITPVFCAYIGWCVLNDILFLLIISKYLNGDRYLRIYLMEMIPDSLFQFAVLVELGWAVLRPIRSSLPRHSIMILTGLFVLAAAVIWPISGHMLPAKLGPLGTFFVHIQQTVAVLRVVIFIVLAGFSQLLSIGWRNRELQIATGLGFYSMCSLCVSMVHSHQAIAANPYYHVLDQIGVAAYVCTLLYWIFSFAQQEQERQEFTPQMRSFLLAMTGASREARVALAEPSLGSRRKNGRS
jgi:hypothetical protein